MPAESACTGTMLWHAQPRLCMLVSRQVSSLAMIWECTMSALVSAATMPSPNMFALQVMGRRFPCCCNSHSPLEAAGLCYLCQTCFLCAISADICAEPDCSAQSHAVQQVLTCTIAQMQRTAHHQLHHVQHSCTGRQSTVTFRWKWKQRRQQVALCNAGISGWTSGSFQTQAGRQMSRTWRV